MLWKVVLKNRKYQYFIITVLCLTCYGYSLNGSFVFDDSVAIVQNADVTNFKSPLWQIFHHDFWGNNLSDPTSHKSYRPLTIIMYRFEHYAFGTSSPIAMKSINLILHILVSCGLIQFYTDFSRSSNRAVPFLAATIFAVHPIHTEAVCGIVGRPEIIVAGLLLIGFRIFHRLIGNEKMPCAKRILLYASILVLTATSVLFKENGITVLPILIVFDMFNFKFLRLAILLIFTVLLIYERLRIMNFESPKFKAMDNPLAASPHLLTRVLTQNFLYALNMWLLICPDWLCFDWALGSIKLVEMIGDQRVLSIAVLYLFFGACFVFGNRCIQQSVLLIVVAFLPASGIVKLGFVIAERILYLPSIGYCLLLAYGLQCISRKLPTKLFFAVALFIHISFMAKTFERSLEWRTETALFRSALRVVPNNAKVYYNIARLSTDHNQKAAAFEYYGRAIELHPKYESAYMNLGNLYREIGDFRRAEKHIKKSIQILQEFPAAWMNLGIVQASQKYYKDAFHSYEKALKYRKRYPVCLYNLGNLYIDTNNDSMALKCWRESVTLDPRQNKAWANILALLDNKGLTEDVIKTSETAMTFHPNDPAILFTRANAFGKIGNYEQSERIFKEIIQMKPTYALYYANLGVLYHRWNRTEDAINSYRKAIRLDPHMKSAHDNLIKLTKK